MQNLNEMLIMQAETISLQAKTIQKQNQLIAELINAGEEQYLDNIDDIKAVSTYLDGTSINER